MPAALIHEIQCERCFQKFISPHEGARLCGHCKAELRKMAAAEPPIVDAVMPSEDAA